MLDVIAAQDAAALLYIQEYLRCGVGNIFLPLWSNLGNGGMVWIIAAVVMLFFHKSRKTGALALGGMGLNLIAVNLVLKRIVARPRPWLVVEGLNTLLRSGDPNSFPSGHTSAAFAFAAVVCMTCKAWWAKAAAVVAAVLMGWSRLYVGVHFPTDVMAGALVGTACGFFGVKLYEKCLERRFPLK